MIVKLLGGSNDALGALRAVVVSVVTFRVLLGMYRFLHSFVFPGIFGLTADVTRSGPWAVVTGCTDGIGKAYAEKLASLGKNMVLISRSLDKLQTLAKELESKYKISTKTIAKDFSRADIYADLASQLDGLDVGVLVNNVGGSYDVPDYYGNLKDPQFVHRLINLNCTSMAKMTQIVLPRMAAKKNGFIINIGSSAGFNPTPLLALYSPTKAFAEWFSRALILEYQDKGITIQCLTPYFIATKLSVLNEENLFVPSAKTYVRHAFKTLGVRSVTIGYWPHYLQDLFTRAFLPDSKFLRFFQDKRQRILSGRKDSNKAD